MNEFASEQLPTVLLLFAAISNLLWLIISGHFFANGKRSDVSDMERMEETAPSRMESPSGLQMIRSWERFFRTHWLEVTAGVISLGLALYIWLLSPGTFSTYASQPKEAGHPFSWFYFIRAFQMRYLNDWAIVLAGVGAFASLGLLTLAYSGRRTRAGYAGMLIAALGLAGLGQMAQLKYYSGNAVWLYLSAVVFLIFWVIGYRTRFDSDFKVSSWSRRSEIALVVLVIALTTFARFYKLSDLPYGAEGDETKWTVEVVATMMDAEYPEAAEYHLSSVPTSFYMQAVFHHLLGPSLLNARITVAVYSILGSLIFYVLTRQLVNIPVALIATALLGVSLLDVSASRLANVESHVKVWPVLALVLLWWALNRQRPILYLLSGFAIALGMLTYETVMPLAIVGLLILLLESFRKKVGLAYGVRNVMLFLFPILWVAPSTINYLSGRIQYYRFGERGLVEDTLPVLANNLKGLLSSLFIQVRSDFLYNREGPLFNSLLIPWLVLGVLLAIVFWKRKRMFWWLIFGVLFFFPISVLLDASMGRVLYPALPAAYALIALAMYVTFKEFERALGSALRPVLLLVTFFGFALFAILNLYIYFNEVSDPPDRRIRRELYEITRTGVKSDRLLYFVYVENADEPIEQENHQTIWLGKRSITKETPGFEGYSVIPLEMLMPSLSAITPEYKQVEVVWDTQASSKLIERNQVLEVLLSCYADVERLRGQFFDRYVIPGTSLQAPLCINASLRLDSQTAVIQEGESIDMAWTLTGMETFKLRFTCTSPTADVVFVPGEDLSGPGWQFTGGSVDGFDGEGLIFDNLGSSTALLRVPLPEGSPVYVWVRSLRRVSDDYPGYAGLNSEHSEFSKVMGTSFPLGEWIWERLGPFSVSGQMADLELSRPFSENGNNFMALFVDTFVLTSSTSFDPNTQSLWQISLEREIVHDGSPNGSFDFMNVSGIYRCSVSVDIPQDGKTVESNTVEIQVLANP